MHESNIADHETFQHLTVAQIDAVRCRVHDSTALLVTKLIFLKFDNL